MGRSAKKVEMIMSLQTNTASKHRAHSFTEMVADGFTMVAASIAARAARTRAARELGQLSDRDLADIGIVRSDIPRVASLAATR